MDITIEAVYEAGVLRPLQPLDALAEHERVRLVVQPLGLVAEQRRSRLKLDPTAAREIGAFAEYDLFGE